jgi:hypothetical protein
VTDKVKEFLGKSGLWVRKIERKGLDIFSRLKDFVVENSLERNDIRIDQYIKDCFFNLQSRFSKYFPGYVSSNESRIHSMLIR